MEILVGIKCKKKNQQEKGRYHEQEYLLQVHRALTGKFLLPQVEYLVRRLCHAHGKAEGHTQSCLEIGLNVTKPMSQSVKGHPWRRLNIQSKSDFSCHIIINI